MYLSQPGDVSAASKETSLEGQYSKLRDAWGCALMFFMGAKSHTGREKKYKVIAFNISFKLNAF